MHDKYTLESIVWGFVPYYGTPVTSLPQDLAPKYLIGLMLWSILQGGNSALKNELHP